MESVGIIAIAGLVIIALLVFTCGWIFVWMIRGIARMFTGGPRQPAFSHGTCTCPRIDCRAANPVHAQFCRRCGETLGRVPGYGAQRVA